MVSSSKNENLPSPIQAIIIPDGYICDYIDSTIFRKDTPEEYVRQNIEKRLVNEHKYKREQISVEFSVKIGSGRKRADLVVFPEGAEKKQENISIQNLGKQRPLIPSRTCRINRGDTLTVEMAEKFQKQFCGLCVGYNEMLWIVDHRGSTKMT